MGIFKEWRGYLRSKNKSIYVEIGVMYQVSPMHVYRLAHGASLRDERDYEILEELKKRGIITHINPY